MLADFKPPTTQELEQIVDNIKQQFPHVVIPSTLPGQGQDILHWMEENFGAIDSSWTVIEQDKVRFREVEDKIAFLLAWQKDF